MSKAKESVSRIVGEIEVRGKGKTLIFLFRHLSPLTVNSLLRAIPIESRAFVQNSMVCIFTSLRVGVEKAKFEFSRGDVAFLPLNSTLCIFLQKVKSERPLNHVGRIENNIELIQDVRSGDVVLIRLSQEERE